MNRTPPLLKALGLQPHFVRLARLTQQELTKANISVAYLLRGFIEGEPVAGYEYTLTPPSLPDPTRYDRPQPTPADPQGPHSHLAPYTDS